MNTVELVSLSDALSQLEPAAAGKRSMILVKTDQIRVVLVRMTAGGHLNEHSAPGRITIHPLSGAFRVSVDGNIHYLTTDSLLTIEHGLVHDVRCVEDGAFLLTIAWHPAD